MGYQKCFSIISLVCFGCIAIEAIKVDFGTRKGPIIPPTSTTKRPEPRNLFIPVPRVWEIQEDDLPTPKPYRPFLPYQYRTKVYNYQKVPPQIYAGTEYDRKYAPENLKNVRLFYPNNNIARSLNLAPTIAAPSQETNYDNNATPQQRKYVITRQNTNQATQQTYYEDKTTSRQTSYDNNGAPKTTGTPGLAYRGPQTFGPEHFNPVPAKYPIQYYAKYDKNAERNGVPELGIVYSSGVRYYVPRVDLSEGGHENSVYDEQDAKY